MQGLSSKTFQRRARFRREAGRLGLEAGRVSLVAEDRVADMREVDADLVRAAGVEAAFDQARYRLAVGSRVALEHLPMRDGLAPAFADCAFVARLRMAVERRVDRALRPRGRAPD